MINESAQEFTKKYGTLDFSQSNMDIVDGLNALTSAFAVTAETPQCQPETQDPIIQRLLSKRSVMSDVSVEDEQERQKRMYNMLRYSQHYRKIQVESANDKWADDLALLDLGNGVDKGIELHLNDNDNFNFSGTQSVPPYFSGLNTSHADSASNSGYSSSCGTSCGTSPTFSRIGKRNKTRRVSFSTTTTEITPYSYTPEDISPTLVISPIIISPESSASTLPKDEKYESTQNVNLAQPAASQIKASAKKKKLKDIPLPKGLRNVINMIFHSKDDLARPIECTD